MNKFLTVATAVAAMALTGVVSAQEIRITTEEGPPFNMMEGGKIVGSNTKIVEAMFAKAGVPYKIELMDWTPAYEAALNNKNTCVYSTYETPERKDKFEWVGPLTKDNLVLFALADSSVAIKTLADAKPFKIGGAKNYAGTLLLQKAGMTVDDSATTDGESLKKLANKTVDLWQSGSNSGLYLAEKQGVKVKPVFTLQEAVMSLACNKGTDPAVLAKLRAALPK